MKLRHQQEQDRQVIEVIEAPRHSDSHAAAECPVCSTRVFPNYSGEERIGCFEHPDDATARNVATVPAETMADWFDTVHRALGDVERSNEDE